MHPPSHTAGNICVCLVSVVKLILNICAQFLYMHMMCSVLLTHNASLRENEGTDYCLEVVAWCVAGHYAQV